MRERTTVELFEEFNRLSLADEFCFRMEFEQCADAAAMVRFHMVND